MGKYPLDADKASSLLPLWQGVLAQQRAKLADTNSENMKVTWANRIVQTERAIAKLKGVLMEQEQRDLWVVWSWMKEHGGTLKDDKVELFFNHHDTWSFSDKESLDWLNQASRWVKQQRKEAQHGESTPIRNG